MRKKEEGKWEIAQKSSKDPSYEEEAQLSFK